MHALKQPALNRRQWQTTDSSPGDDHIGWQWRWMMSLMGDVKGGEVLVGVATTGRADRQKAARMEHEAVGSVGQQMTLKRLHPSPLALVRNQWWSHELVPPPVLFQTLVCSLVGSSL